MKARALAAAIGIAAAALLAGCAPTVTLHPAPPHANDRHCADVMVHLPDTLDSQNGVLVHRETDAQSTAAWGDPTSVILSCGVRVPGPSALPCVQDTGGVYWLRQKNAKTKIWTFTTFGRDPAAQLTISTRLSPGVVLDQLGNQIAAALPKTGHVCSSTEDTVTGGGTSSDTPTPSPTPTG
ncbi:hypothetical protein GCM10009840_16170 [Pseudolysinimonas kribbensis]|uniref:DUF3515 domain-containing protein n=1 Tax=Pseudolysinimonas kribbensis TaxID=433641 RepID=A0ABQ6K394_9MICO|nr:DUF3515 family protein [Pseudolysinimonas kribbensis]GMA94023.1 hypothetical protein GCM10025881_08470 [Pseudolysinimonas kribbensis]